MFSKLKKAYKPNYSRYLSTLQGNKYPFLSKLGINEENFGVCNGEWFGNGIKRESINPCNGEIIGVVTEGTMDDYNKCIKSMNDVKSLWMNTPAPQRGNVVRRIGELLREKKEYLGSLISLENGKILGEGLGEVQEAIDICDYALGLSRMLNGKVIPSERDGHIMYECYNPLKGHVGIITAFNFPCAVAFWNSAISLVCGNTQIWKGSQTTNLVSIACTKIIQQALIDNGFPGSIACSINGGIDIGSAICNDNSMELVSFTGSTQVGRQVNEVISKRFGKCILELGGNNGQIIMNDCDINMAIDSVAFGAIGTAGQRCTSLRRLFVQDNIYDEFLTKLISKYDKIIKYGNPLDSDTLVGPLINKSAVDNYINGINRIKSSQNSKILYGGKVLTNLGNYVEPTIVETVYNEEFVNEELFAPVLYVMKFKDLNDVIKQHNTSKHGLSSALFTTNMQNVFEWIGPNGSDCGLVNVNIGTSGAEIGGAFGGEKDTGIGRESGSDAWKQYMRRSTCTINYSKQLPLAQGIKFGSD